KWRRCRPPDFRKLRRRPGEGRDPYTVTTIVEHKGRRRLLTTDDRGYGSPGFTNEVQHFLQEVLPWGGITSSFPLRTGAGLPSFLPLAPRSGKSRQLWI